MLKSYKTEINPTSEQIARIRRTMGVCRYVYNLFIAENKRRHDAGEKYMSHVEFSKWLNKEYLPAHPEYG